MAYHKMFSLESMPYSCENFYIEMFSHGAWLDLYCLQDCSACQGSCLQVRPLGLDPWDPQRGSKELNSTSCPLTSKPTPWHMPLPTQLAK